jgi:hypothetical protein
LIKTHGKVSPASKGAGISSTYLLPKHLEKSRNLGLDEKNGAVE